MKYGHKGDMKYGSKKTSSTPKVKTPRSMTTYIKKPK